MADGVDHIDIYADVGEEFNQVREGPGSAADADAAAARTLTRAAAGREPARLQTVRPWRLRAAPRPLTPCSRASFCGPRGSGARGPVSVQPPPARPFRGPASRPIVGYGGGRFPPS